MAQASPQLEDGYVRIADEYLEALIAADYPSSLLRFVLAVVRETWGWRETERAIPIKRFEKLLGIGRRRVYQLRKEAVEHNLITVTEGEHSDTAIYAVQKRYTDWLMWKSKRRWKWEPVKDVFHSEGRATVNDGVHDHSEGRASLHSEGRASHSYVQISTTTNKRLNDLNDSPEKDVLHSEGRASHPYAVDPSADTSYLQQEWPALRNAIWDLNIPTHLKQRWIRVLVNAVEGAGDRWVESEEQMVGLLAEFPPKASEETLPGKWLERVEKARAPTRSGAYAVPHEWVGDEFEKLGFTR